MGVYHAHSKAPLVSGAWHRGAWSSLGQGVRSRSLRGGRDFPRTFCPLGLLPGDRNCEGYHGTEQEEEKPLPAVGCPLRLCESSCWGDRGCAGRGAGRVGRSTAAAVCPGSSSTGRSFITQTLVPACRAPGTHVSRTHLEQHQWGIHPAVPGREAVVQARGAEPCLSKTSPQANRAGSVLSQRSAMKRGTVTLACRRCMLSAEPGSHRGDQQLPWCLMREAMAGAGGARASVPAGLGWPMWPLHWLQRCRQRGGHAVPGQAPGSGF